MKKEYLSKNGFLMLELIVGLAVLSLCSLLVAQWYVQVIAEEQKTIALVQESLEIASVMNKIKAHKLPLTGSRDTIHWSSKTFGKSLPGHWVTITSSNKKLLFGVP